MRTSRTNGTKTYNYVYNGSQLVQMTVGNDTLHFTYGLLGPTTVTWNGDADYYALNGQGDVIGIFDEYGTLVVTYNWDNAWGYNPLPEGSMASTLGALNPLRYRSYVYDIETGYYYLQSRYYDPEIGRFINADALVATGQGMLGNNMFAYCNNNPVNLLDPTGDIAITTIILFGSAIIGAAAAGYTAYKEYQAGYDTVRIVGDSICAGFTAFSIVYTGGMSLYQCYQNYCALNAITPVTEIKGGSRVPGAASSQVAVLEKQNSPVSHTKGTGSPEKNINPGGSYTKLDNNGQLYSYSQFDDLGRQTMRVDYQGKPHAGVLPHIHLYVYLRRGGRAEYTFDLKWRLID